ncbi:MAG: efflux RND transporter periplasmic adaptor subunit [Candidatus Saccharimonadaceae bacterium]
MIKYKTVLKSILLLLIVSCSNEHKNISTYTVTRKNFESIIIIDGYAEPVQSTTVTCPNGGGGGTVAFLIEDGTWVNEGDLLCTIENQSLETRYDQLLTNLENAKAGIEKTKAELSLQYTLLEADAKNNEAETQIAHLDSTRLQYYSPNQKHIRELELQIVGITRRKIEMKLASLTIIQQSEIRKLELEIQRLKNNVESVKKDLDALVLKSTKKGLAIRGTNPMTNNKMAVGDMVWNGMPLVNIPEMNKMKMKIFASERDYRYINVNDSVHYMFDALEENVAWGKILSKMPVGKEIKEGSKIKYFEIDASVDSTLVMPDPGFTATCYISLKQVKDTLTIPQIAIFEQDSMKVVYVENKKGFEMRQVLIGESSPKDAVVTSGLYLDERIALSLPKESQIKSKKILSDSISISKK